MRYLLLTLLLATSTAIARDHKGPPSPFMQCRNQGGTDASCKHLLPVNPGVKEIERQSKAAAEGSKGYGNKPGKATPPPSPPVAPRR